MIDEILFDSVDPINSYAQYYAVSEKAVETQETVSVRASAKSFKTLRNETLLLERSIHANYLGSSIAQIERRAAVDVGSGSTKVCIADVNMETNQIVQVVFDGSFPVPYQAYLETSPDLTFNEEIQEKGLAAFAKVKELLEQHQVTHVAAVATEAFRKAPNGEEFAQRIQETTGIPLQVISQQEEGAIAFFSAVAASRQNPEDLLVWDIGTGSFQITADNEVNHEIAVYMQSMGSVPFKNYLIKDVQGHDPAVVKSPNPMTEQDWQKADALARKMGRHAFDLIKEKIKVVEGSVVGIGRLFSSSVKPIGTDGKITRADLRAFIRESLNHTDEELGDPFASVNVSNAILVLGVMKALHIHEINIIETTSTKGILCYEPYWNPVTA